MLKPKFSSCYFLRTCLVNVWYYNQSGLDERWSLEAVEWLNKSSLKYIQPWNGFGLDPFRVFLFWWSNYANLLSTCLFSVWNFNADSNVESNMKHVFIVNLILKRTRESEVWWLLLLSFHEKLIKSSSSTVVEIKYSFKR